MKKITLLIACLLCSCISIYAQTFAGPGSATSGSTITLTAQGESATDYDYVNHQWLACYYFYNIIGINNNDNVLPSNPPNASQYINISLNHVDNIYTANNPSPTTIKVDVKNTWRDPITVTFKVLTQYWYSKGTSPVTGTGVVGIPYTITINPSSTSGGGTGTPAPSAPTGGGTNTNYLYRFRSPSRGNYVFTDSNSEYVSLVQSGWVYEGALGFVWTSSQSGTTPLVRFRKNSTGEFIITTSSAEMSSLSSSGWTREGAVGYVYSTQVPGSTPLYRYYATSGNGGHIFTTSFSELGNGNSGWTYEGIACYVLTAAQ